jgi:DNA-binding beta-propeller fold protein YncE
MRRHAAALTLALTAAHAAPPAPAPLNIGAPNAGAMLFAPATGRLYIAHGKEIAVVDTHAKTIAGHIGGFNNAKGLAIAPNGHLYASSSKEATVLVIDIETLQELAEIPTDADTSAVVYDPATTNVFALNDDAGTITVIDTKTDKSVFTIHLPGGEGLTAAAADGHGHLYVDHPARQELVRIDTRTRNVDAMLPLPDCPKPTALALNPPDNRAYIACDNAKLLIIDTAANTVLATLPIGPGSQSVLYDLPNRRLYIPGTDGTLSAVDISDARAPRWFPGTTTAPGVRTAAQDQATGTIFYVASGEVKELHPPK